MTLIIDNAAVEQVLKPAEINDALEAAHVDLAQDRAANSQPYRLLTPVDPADYGDRFPAGGDPAHHSFTSLSGAISRLGVTVDRIDSDIITYVPSAEGGVRRVRVPAHPEGKFCGLVFVYSSQTGEPLAIIHDGYLQKFRVAGTGAVGAKHLARADSRILGLIGTGWQAEAAVECMAAALDLDEIRVYSPTPGKKEAFAERWSDVVGLPIRPVADARSAVAGADVVYTATNSPQFVVADEWIEPGQFVSGVTDLEVEMSAWERCDVLTTVRRGTRWVRTAIGGTQRIPEQSKEYINQASTIDWDGMPLLGDVISGAHPGRTSDDQFTGLILRGDGVQFAATGHLIYERCKEAGLGTEIDTDLFLQDERYIP